MSGATLRWLVTLARRPGNGRAGDPRLIVLRHHHVYADGERPLQRLGVSASVFRAQLELLATHGLTPVTVREGRARLAAGAPGATVALTFDDGYADNVERALPLLLAAGARATFYLTAGLMERREAPWWDQVADAVARTRAPFLPRHRGGVELRLPLGGHAARARALDAILPDFRLAPAARAARIAALRETLGVREPAPCALMTWDEAARLREAGMEIGAHTLDHPHLSLLSEDEQAREIVGSIALIERRLGIRPEGLAYPDGDHDARTIAAARAAGLAYAVTTRAGENGPGSAAFTLRRRPFPEGACLGPRGRFAPRLAMAEIEGAFDGLRDLRRAAR